MLNRSGELQPWPNTNPNINTNTNTNTNANTKMIQKYQSEGMCFLLIMKKIDWDPVTKLHLQWEISNSCLNFEWCCTSLLPCLAPLQSNSGKTWRREYQCFIIWITTKESWPSFVERQKTQQLKKNWSEAQSGFNLKEVHCTMWLSFCKSSSRENLFLCSHFIEI